MGGRQREDDGGGDQLEANLQVPRDRPTRGESRRIRATRDDDDLASELKARERPIAAHGGERRRVRGGMAMAAFPGEVAARPTGREATTGRSREASRRRRGAARLRRGRRREEREEKKLRDRKSVV